MAGPARPDARIVSLIEAIDQPLLLVQRQRIVAANQPALALLGAHIVGQDVRLALRHPDVVALLNSDQGGEAAVSGLSTPSSLWEVGVAPIADGDMLVKLHDRSAQSDVSRAHTDFVANASHELRTPLSAIIGYAETLLDDKAAADSATRARFLGVVHREATRLQRLVEDLMSLSRIEAERHDAPRARVELARLVQIILREIEAAGHSPSLLSLAADGEFTITGDAAQLSQLVRNLIDNAIRYGGAGKAVRIALDRNKRGKITLSVSDEGDGIGAEHIPRLTERFYRVDPARSREAGGTGLGLAIVKHIVQRHRGQLDFKSATGIGTTVTVTFPPA